MSDNRLAHISLGFIVLIVFLFCVLSATGHAHAYQGYEDDLDEQTRVPRLVGYGCKGSSGPLYANEEDHFPMPCDRIEAWR